MFKIGDRVKYNRTSSDDKYYSEWKTEYVSLQGLQGVVELLSFNEWGEVDACRVVLDRIPGYSQVVHISNLELLY